MYLRYSPHPKFDPNVKVIQQKLNVIKTSVHGNWPYLDDDGLFGPMTKQAVMGYQSYKAITPVSGDVGDTTLRYIQEDYNKVPQLRNVSPDTQLYKPKQRDPYQLSHVVAGTGTAAGWGALLASDSKWVIHLIEALPQVYVRMEKWQQKPLFVFNKNEAYRGSLYKRVNLPNTIAHHLTVFAWVCQIFTIRPALEEYNRKKASLTAGELFSERVKLGGSVLSLILGTPDALIKLKPMMRNNRFLLTGATTVSKGFTATLSRINAYIGAFLLGWTIGELIGKIPCGDGHNVQYYIDLYIDEVWEHPYKTIGLCPGGMGIATLIVLWKKSIDLWVNRVSNLKPLTPEEKKRFEQIINQV